MGTVCQGKMYARDMPKICPKQCIKGCVNPLHWNENIMESTSDSFWGSSMPLHHQDCLNPRQWHSKGIMSEILMDLRDEFRSELEPPVHRPEVHTSASTRSNTMNTPALTQTMVLSTSTVNTQIQRMPHQLWKFNN